MQIETLPVRGESAPVAPQIVSLPRSSPPEALIPNLAPVIPRDLPGPGHDHSQLIRWVQPPMCWNDHVVLDRFGPPLPVERCCQCNEPADRTVRKTFSAGGLAGLVAVLILPILLPIALLARPTRCRASVEFGICTRCWGRRLFGLSMGIAGMIAAWALFVQALLAEGEAGFWFLMGGVLCLVLGVRTLVGSISLGFPRRIDRRWLIIKAGGKKFRASLPQSPIPQF